MPVKLVMAAGNPYTFKNRFSKTKNRTGISGSGVFGL